MKRFIYLIGLFSYFSIAQVGIGTESLDPNAILQLESKNKGLLFTRMSTKERDEISSPPEGLTIYNTTGRCLEYWNGETWICTGYGKKNLKIRREQIPVKGAFIKGTSSSGKIILKVDYNEMGTYEVNLSDAVFVEGVEGLKVEPNPRKVNINPGENILTYDVKGIPAGEGISTFKIPVLGDSCIVKISVEKEPEITINYKAILNAPGRVEANPKIGTGFEIVDTPTITWETADDENGANKRSLSSSKSNEKIIIPLVEANRYLSYKTTIKYKKGNTTGERTLTGLVGKIEPLPIGYIPAKEGNGIFTYTKDKYNGHEFFEKNPCRNISVSVPLNVIGYNEMMIGAGLGDKKNPDNAYRGNFPSTERYYWWMDKHNDKHWGHDIETGENREWSLTYSGGYYQYHGLCLIPL